MAIVAEGRTGRVYLSPNEAHEKAARISRPDDCPQGEMPKNPRSFSPPIFGLEEFSDIFTARQLTALTTFSDLVAEAQHKATQDALAYGMADDGRGLAEGGSGATAYGQAIGVYLAFAVDKMVDYHSTICVWHTTRDLVANTMRRQAIQMTWDYAEANPYSHSSGCFENMLNWIVNCLSSIPTSTRGTVKQIYVQQNCGLRNLVISTDPPYYDNIGYADLSDFFYIWMRRSLKKTYPQLFRTMLVPKAEELVATPYRFEGSKDRARDFFEEGMVTACRHIYTYAREDVPVTIFYAYKQSETDESEGGSQASTGWETMLSAIIRAGFAITGTWPMRTELTSALKGSINALASSIVLVCRKRASDAPACTRRDFLAALRRELRPAIATLQTSNIAPVDMAQAAIGPGMAVYSRYAKVLEADGTALSVRKALHLINQELDAFLTEQDCDMDDASRLCLELYRQKGFGDISFGEADVLARARNTSIDALARLGLVSAQRGLVHLITRDQLARPDERSAQHIWLLTQQTAQAMQQDGIAGCVDILRRPGILSPDRVKNLAYRLFSLADQKGWSQEALAYNALVVHWPDIERSLAQQTPQTVRQRTLMDLQNDN